MQEHAISTPIALKSAANHIKYDDCSFTGSHNTFTIKYLTFYHTIESTNPFEFSISPGMDSSLPILWKPNSNSLCPSLSAILSSQCQNAIQKYNKSPIIECPTHEHCLIQSTNTICSQPTSCQQFQNYHHIQKMSYHQNKLSITSKPALQTLTWLLRINCSQKYPPINQE